MRLGLYDITALLGTGGMGEVYRATDTKLKRQVALKVLPVTLTLDADRLARFQREAEVLASLNHPNIAQIHGLEDASGVRALVMELVEGPTLADRIFHGAPLNEALPIAKQITEALEADATPNDWRPYDVSPDGQRFLMIKDSAGGPQSAQVLVVVQNWLEELKRLVPPK